MPVKLLIALMLTVTCAISPQCVDARTLRKSSPSDDVTGDDVTSRDTVVKRSASEVHGGHHAQRAPAVVDVPIMAGPRGGARSVRSVSNARSLLSDDERSKFAGLLADVLLLERLRHRRPPERHLGELLAEPYDEDLMGSMQEAGGFRENYIRSTLDSVRTPPALPSTRTPACWPTRRDERVLSSNSKVRRTLSGSSAKGEYTVNGS